MTDGIEIGFGFYIDEPRLVPAIGEYVTFIETGETKDTCKCQWLEDHSTGLKMQRVEESLECPVHTKEGFLLGFFRWMFPDADITRPEVPEPQPEPAKIDWRSEYDFPAHVNKDGSGVWTQNSGEPINTGDLSAVLKARIGASEFRQAPVVVGITSEDHNYNMPHDSRVGWDSVAGCPPNCPARDKYARLTNAGE